MSLNSNPVRVVFPPGSVALYYKGYAKIFTKDSPEYNSVKEIIQGSDKEVKENLLVEFFENLLVKPVNKNVNADFEVSEVNGEVSVNGKVLPRVLGQRLLSHKSEGLPYEPILKFWERLNKNPSYLTVQRLFECLEVNKHPFLEDGRFLAWRKVRRNSEGKLVDIYTGKIDNSVGQKPRMERNEVEDNPDITCSRGYHASSWDYAKNHYGNSSDVMLEVAICPSDVVSVPKDYNSQKIRICSYEVLAEVEMEDTGLMAGHKVNHSFAKNPDEDFTCEDCLNHYDYCTCDDEDGDWDDEEICENCNTPLDNCECCPNCDELPENCVCEP